MLGLLAVLEVASVTPPGLTPATTPAAVVDPNSYVTVDLVLGGYQDFVLSGAELQIGHRISDSPVWLHVAGSAGGGGPLLANGQGSHQRVGGGLELRGCASPGSGACLFAGEDLGYIHAKFDGDDGSWFGDPTPIHESYDQMIATTRMGFEVGGTNARFHLELEIPVDVVGNWTGDNHSGHGVLVSAGATIAF